MVRHSYRHEMRSAMTFPLAAALAEGSFTSIIAAKYFHASPLLIAVIVAAPMFGNIAALIWAELARGRPLVRMVNLLQLGVVTLIASVALTGLLPRAEGGGIGGWTFAAIIIATRVLASGIVTLRSAIWRANYPRQFRAQIVSRITLIATAALGSTSMLGSIWLDQQVRQGADILPLLIYPAAAVLGLFGIWQFRQIRVRREKTALRRFAALYTPRPENLAQTDEANVLNYEPSRERPSIVQLFRNASAILRSDANFRNYQKYQFLSGFSFMMFQPALVFLVSQQLTDPRRDYFLSNIILQAIPTVMVLAGLQLWAPIFDRLNIWQFRLRHGRFSVAGIALMAAAAYVGPNSVPTALVIVALAQALIGISSGGGNLAWSLGHNDFATRERSADYMAVHVMLTGVRGSLAPFLGAILFMQPSLGQHVFVLSLAVQLMAQAGFYRHSRLAPPRQATAAPAPRPVSAAGAASDE